MVYADNKNCDCDPLIDCCPGSVYPAKNCKCDSALTCCPGETWKTGNNPFCKCDPNKECCTIYGDTYKNNPICPCDSNSNCCNGDTFESNPNFCICDPKTNPNKCCGLGTLWTISENVGETCCKIGDPVCCDPSIDTKCMEPFRCDCAYPGDPEGL